MEWSAKPFLGPDLSDMLLVRTVATFLCSLLANATFCSTRLRLQLQQCSPTVRAAEQESVLLQIY
jgi:hypothetical protein